MAHAAFLASPACPALGPSRLTAPPHRRVPSKPSRLITRAKAADDVEDEAIPPVTTEGDAAAT